MSPGGKETATSGGEREDADLASRRLPDFQTFPSVRQGELPSGGRVGEGWGGPGPRSGRGPGDRGSHWYQGGTGGA